MALFCIGKVAEECRGGCNRHNRVQTSLVGRQRRAAMRPREPRATVGLGVSPSPSQVALGPERERPTRSCVLRARRPVDRGERAAAAVNKMKKMRQCPTYWLWLEGFGERPARERPGRRDQDEMASNLNRVILVCQCSHANEGGRSREDG